MLDQERIDELIRQIKYYDYKWYKEGKRIVSDIQLEALRKELSFLEHKTNYLREDSPSLSVGYLNPSYRTIKHIPPMLSLNKTYELEDLKFFIQKNLDLGRAMIIQPKLDGVAASVIYINGLIDGMYLRGNGKEGEDISHHIHGIKLPYQLHNIPPYFILRGEIIPMNNNKSSNTRNIIAGLLNRKIPIDGDNLCFIPYAHYPADCNIDRNAINFIDTFNIKDINEIDNIINNKKYANSDGFVAKISDPYLFDGAGFTERFPKGALAFKFSSTGVSTEIIDIKWSISRKKQLIPVAIVSPITINGTKINNVFLHNYAQCILKQIGIGAKIKINKQGDVIPTIVEVLQTSAPPEVNSCPFCHHEIKYTAPHLYCTGECLQVIVEKVIFFLQTIGVAWIEQNFIKSLKPISILDFFQRYESENCDARMLSEIKKVIPTDNITILRGMGVTKNQIKQCQLPQDHNPEEYEKLCQLLT